MSNDRSRQSVRNSWKAYYPRKLITLFTEAIHLRNRHQKGEVSAEQLRPARQEFE